MNRYEEFVRSITALNRCITRIENDAMKQFDLHGADELVLMELKYHPEGLSSSELCRICESDKGAMSRTLARLLGKGIIEQEKADGKKYGIPMRLTDKGIAVTDEMEKIIRKIVEASSADMDEESRHHFYQALKEITANMKKLIREEKA